MRATAVRGFGTAWGYMARLARERAARASLSSLSVVHGNVGSCANATRCSSKTPPTFGATHADPGGWPHPRSEAFSIACRLHGASWSRTRTSSSLASVVRDRERSGSSRPPTRARSCPWLTGKRRRNLRRLFGVAPPWGTRDAGHDRLCHFGIACPYMARLARGTCTQARPSRERRARSRTRWLEPATDELEFVGGRVSFEGPAPRLVP